MTDTLPPSPTDGNTDLYRYYDAEGRLLYVGISFSAIARAAQHRSGKGWWPQVANMTVEHLPTRQDALEAERVAILTERPIYNIAGRTTPRKNVDGWECQGCGRPMGRRVGQGFVQFVNNSWQAVCSRCDEAGDAVTYWIDASRISNLEDVASWTDHLCDKSWFDEHSWVRCLRWSCAIANAVDAAKRGLANRAPEVQARQEWKQMRHAEMLGHATGSELDFLRASIYTRDELVECSKFIKARTASIKGEHADLRDAGYSECKTCGTYAKIHHTSDKRACGHFYCWSCEEHFRVWWSWGDKWPSDAPVWPDWMSDPLTDNDRHALWSEHADLVRSARRMAVGITA